ncbi:MAG: hypothetical protein GDA36_05975 [Rhodobacteraceae bacterium]|nr:hypothetical protein [Paracoccaceae bacterium]
MGHSVRSAGLTMGKAVLVVGLRDCRCLRVVLVSPHYRAVLHRGIGSAQSRKRRLEFSLPPRCSQARRD